MKEELIKKLMQIQIQWKFLHWQTFGDAKHRLYGEIYDGLGDLIDGFTETMMGKYGRPEFDAEFGLMFQLPIGPSLVFLEEKLKENMLKKIKPNDFETLCNMNMEMRIDKKKFKDKFAKNFEKALILLI